jgi:hypothetical protein
VELVVDVARSKDLLIQWVPSLPYQLVLEVKCQ